MGRVKYSGIDVYVWCELVCKTCSKTIGGQFTLGATVPRSTQVKEAIQRGWTFKDREAYCSKACKNKG